MIHSVRFVFPFESFANSERYKTGDTDWVTATGLRALLIQKDTKRHHGSEHHGRAFESFANSERYKTYSSTIGHLLRLRALLIQKDTKLFFVLTFGMHV